MTAPGTSVASGRTTDTTGATVTLSVNGAAQTVPADTTVAGIVADTTDRALQDDGTCADGQRLGIAVALDSAVVPRSRWSATGLRDGQSIEIITAMQGG